ncbi:hypothetical protein [Streptomyces iconiensis]|uniref:Uncharacterized protein n=1 Tax=Streptomyces iconiensis TaxID=1384038 RepID=A0ABT6ZYA3_9ACTN|nr:hypothetical protein [Streptomyces iconiensis]MDJ1134040.1 hypothetical protein [Streptomyces iconiensis]
MKLPDRKEAEVRRLLEAPVLPLPPDLAERALVLGARLVRRRRLLHLAVCVLLVAVLLGLGVWALTAEPWSTPPPATSPTRGW